jgi:hypothetical protein
LWFSIVGLVSLLVIKRFELSTGAVFLGSVRPKVGALFHTTLVWVERSLPALAVSALEQSSARGRSLVHYLTAHAVIVAERMLERTLGVLRYLTQPQIGGSTRQASSFLREVAEHKRKLLKHSPVPVSSHPQVATENH